MSKARLVQSPSRLREAAGFDDRWQVEYANYGDTFVFTFYPDGTGVCQEQTDYGGEAARVDVEWDAKLIQGMPESEIQETLEMLAAELFWDDVNDKLEDPVLTDDFIGENDDTNIHFAKGSEEELEALTRLILCSFPSLWDAERGRDSLSISFTAGGEHVEGPGIDDDELPLGRATPDAEREASRVRELLEFALALNEPWGEHLEYNDGAYNRMSGYSWYANSIPVVIERPSFHEIAEARQALRERLAVHMSPQDLDQLLPDE